jgi:hypothetical protein
MFLEDEIDWGIKNKNFSIFAHIKKFKIVKLYRNLYTLY